MLGNDRKAGSVINGFVRGWHGVTDNPTDPTLWVQPLGKVRELIQGKDWDYLLTHPVEAGAKASGRGNHPLGPDYFQNLPWIEFTNDQARALYTAMGFKKVEDFTRYLDATGLVKQPDPDASAFLRVAKRILDTTRLIQLYKLTEEFGVCYSAIVFKLEKDLGSEVEKLQPASIKEFLELEIEKNTRKPESGPQEGLRF
jgi:hypothetical protein